MEHTFCIGDLVEMVKPEICDHLERLVVGTCGTILAINRDKRIGVKWDDDVGGHDLEGRCEYGYGWWVPQEACELYTSGIVGNAKPCSSDELFAFLGI